MFPISYKRMPQPPLHGGIVFEPVASGREVVRLGLVVVGEVAENLGGRQVQAWARIFLPDVTKRALPATSMEDAKEIVRRKVAEWIEAAGLTI